MELLLGAAITLGILGMVFGIGLAIASDKFAVKVDPRIDSINEVLPGANCGACGQPGCSGFAQAVVEGKAPVSGCTVGQASVAKLVASIMGVKLENRERVVSVVMCHARGVKNKFTYNGIKDCRAANIVGGGFLGCDYGCLGLGTCVDGKRKYFMRQYIIEPVFGHLKFNVGYRNFLLRGLEKVRAEFKLMCIGWNLKKMLKLGIKPVRI